MISPEEFQNKPWSQQPGENSGQYAAFMVYLGLGIKRSIRAAMDAAGENPGNARTWERWSSKHDWVARSQAYDSDHLVATFKHRPERREGTRQIAYDKAPHLMDIVIGIAEGRMPEGDKEVVCGRDGKPQEVPVLDANGELTSVAVTRPMVQPRVRLSACEFVLGLAGLVEAKKLTVESTEGDDVRLALRGSVSKLDPETKALLVEALRLSRNSD